MKKILIGMVGDGNTGGVDAYILRFFYAVKDDELKIDFLTNFPNNPLKTSPSMFGSEFYYVSGLKNPKRQYAEIKKILSENTYDIFYMNISTALTYPALKAAYDCGVKRIIAHSHSAGYDCSNNLKRRIFTILHKLSKRKICRYANEFYTCSDKAAEWMFTEKIIAENKIVHIQNCADIKKFSFDNCKREKLRKEMHIFDEFVIGTVGNMLYSKNYLFLIDVFAEVHKRCGNTVLVIIGDGPLREQIETKIEALGLKESVRLLGRVDASLGYMSAFDVFALPSNFEGMPTVSVEAQMSELPCVLSENITREAKISNACDFVKLRQIDLWAEELLKYKDFKRESFIFERDVKCFSDDGYAERLRNIVWG